MPEPCRVAAIQMVSEWALEANLAAAGELVAEAAERGAQLAVLPEHSIYVGDARRDIESGRAAGTATIAVRYGYIEPGQDPDGWDADFVVSTPAELSQLIFG